MSRKALNHRRHFVMSLHNYNSFPGLRFNETRVTGLVVSGAYLKNTLGGILAGVLIERLTKKLPNITSLQLKNLPSIANICKDL